MRIWVSILLLCAIGVAFASPVLAGSGQSSAAVYPDIIDGDVAFSAHPARAEAWNMAGPDKHPTFEPQNARSTQNNALNTNTSEMILDKVVIGKSQVTSEQQFRFTVADTPISGLTTAEVYNSLRGGWSLVSVGQNANCALDATYRNRMEYLKC